MTPPLAPPPVAVTPPADVVVYRLPWSSKTSAPNRSSGAAELKGVENRFRPFTPRARAQLENYTGIIAAAVFGGAVEIALGVENEARFGPGPVAVHAVIREGVEQLLGPLRA